MLYFDNISELANITRPLFIQNKTSIREASLCTMILILSFQLFKKQTILWRYRVWTQMNTILIYQFPTCYLYFLHHKIRISLGKFWILRRFIINQMLFFQMVFVESAFATVLHFKSFRQFQNLSEETRSHVACNFMEICFLIFLTSHTGLNNFPVFSNYHDIHIAIACMDVLATNA